MGQCSPGERPVPRRSGESARTAVAPAAQRLACKPVAPAGSPSAPCTAMRPQSPVAAVSGGGIPNGQQSANFGRQLDITILEAHLVRIFDSMKATQDVFVQLVCSYEDGSEKVVGRTPTAKGGNLAPKWNQTFETRRGVGKRLKFKVFVDHLFRNPVLCGEAEFDLDTLWTRAAGAGAGLKVPVTLFKRNEQTGVLYIGLVMQSEAVAAPPLQQQPQRGTMQGAAGGAPGAVAVNGVRRGSSPGDAAWGAPYPGGGGVEAAALAPAGYPGPGPAVAPGGRPPQPGGQLPGAGLQVPGAGLPLAGAGLPLAGAVAQRPPAAAGGRQDSRPGMQPPDSGGGMPPQIQVQPAAQPQLQPAQVQQLQQGQLLPPPAQGGGGALPPPSGTAYPGTQQSVYASGMSGQWWNSFIDRG